MDTMWWHVNRIMRQWETGLDGLNPVEDNHFFWKKWDLFSIQVGDRAFQKSDCQVCLLQEIRNKDSYKI